MTDVIIKFVGDYGPTYAHDSDAGFDLIAAIKSPMVLWPGEIKMVPTGIKVQLPEGYEVQIRPRSGLATQGITIVNAPGTIDSGFRGEIMVIMTSLTRPTTIQPGDKIAQGVIAPIWRAKFERVDQLEDSERGENGFGSSDNQKIPDNFIDAIRVDLAKKS